MNHELRNFAQDCVNHYATYESCDDFYDLDVEELPDFVQHEFAALIMAHDSMLASEATGPDNKHYDNKMLPALLRYLKDSTDKDEGIEFKNIWRDCVTDYLKSTMQGLIEDALSDFNADHGCNHEPSYYYGVPAHGPI